MDIPKIYKPKEVVEDLEHKDVDLAIGKIEVDHDRLSRQEFDQLARGCETRSHGMIHVEDKMGMVTEIWADVEDNSLGFPIKKSEKLWDVHDDEAEHTNMDAMKRLKDKEEVLSHEIDTAA